MAQLANGLPNRSILWHTTRHVFSPRNRHTRYTILFSIF